jgi:hypothetical protein
LRKLWAKLAERDWRTTLKALYLLHAIAAQVEPEDAVKQEEENKSAAPLHPVS